MNAKDTIRTQKKMNDKKHFLNLSLTISYFFRCFVIAHLSKIIDKLYMGVSRLLLSQMGLLKAFDTI